MASDPNRRPTASHDKSPGGSVDAVDTPDASYHPRAASARGAERRTRTQRRDAPSRDTASDEATAAFVRRVLCGRRGGSKERVHARPIEELLPPLTSSNEVDLELYAVVAVVVREFVDPWYADFTSDRAFVDEVVGIVAHCTRALEQRMREVDVEALLLDEMPALVDAHVSGSCGDGGLRWTVLTDRQPVGWRASRSDRRRWLPILDVSTTACFLTRRCRRCRTRRGPRRSRSSRRTRARTGSFSCRERWPSFCRRRTLRTPASGRSWPRFWGR